MRLECVEYCNPHWQVEEFPTDWLDAWDLGATGTDDENDDEDDEPDAVKRLDRCITHFTRDGYDDFDVRRQLKMSIDVFREADQRIARILEKEIMATDVDIGGFQFRNENVGYSIPLTDLQAPHRRATVDAPYLRNDQILLNADLLFGSDADSNVYWDFGLYLYCKTDNPDRSDVDDPEMVLSGDQLSQFLAQQTWR